MGATGTRADVGFGKADAVFLNGSVLTVDARNSTAEAVAPTYEEVRHALLVTGRRYLELGITSSHDAGSGAVSIRAMAEKVFTPRVRRPEALGIYSGEEGQRSAFPVLWYNGPMKRTSVLLLLPTRPQTVILATVADRAAALWNSANYRCRQAFVTGGHVPGYEALCREFVSHSAYRALPSDVAQETLKKVAAAWRSFFALRRAFGQRKLERKPHPPRYWKDRKTGQRLSRGIFIKSPRSFSVSRKALALALPSDLRRGPGDRLVIQTRGLLRYNGELRTCELQPDSMTRRWYAYITVETLEPVRASRPERWAGIDLNARILAAVAVQGCAAVQLYRGREIWREFSYWTRRIAREQARLAQQGLRTSRAVRRLYRRRRLRLLHALQALARQVVVGLRRDGVTNMALEDLTGIREHMDFGPGNLLVHNFWAFARWRRTLEAALGRVGIRVVTVQARGTSSHCAVCGQPVARPVRHKVVCHHCGTVSHADANAARNILNKAAGFQAPSKGDGAEAKAPAPLALRWDRHRWVPTGAKSAAAHASRDSKAA